MDAFSVTGGRPLEGRVSVSGAKNAALPILFACLLCRGKVTLRNVPRLRDIASTLALLQELGVSCRRSGGALRAEVPAALAGGTASYDLVRTMRASILCLGPLLARQGRAEVSLPGGCAIGARPVDIHIEGLRQMGARIEIRNGYLIARCRRLRGADITLPLPTVTGTENLMMAAALADGETTLRGAAREPEVTDLANFLRAAGADIRGAGGSRITIRGAPALSGADYTVMPDRIEAGTYLAATAACGGEVFLDGARGEDMAEILAVFGGGGLVIRPQAAGLQISMPRRFGGANAVTAAYPGFPTDMQAQLMAANTIARRDTEISETVFENRFMHVPELCRMGANIRLRGRRACITKVSALTAASVMATDLRASASLVIAALAAEGKSAVRRIYHLDRGYEQMEKKLRALGAEVRRIRE